MNEIVDTSIAGEDIVRVRRFTTEALLAILQRSRVTAGDTNFGKRLDTVIAVLQDAAMWRKTMTVVEPTNQDDLLETIESHLGIASVSEDSAIWKTLRREYDEKTKADAPAAVYERRPKRERELGPTDKRSPGDRDAGGRTRQR